METTRRGRLPGKASVANITRIFAVPVRSTLSGSPATVPATRTTALLVVVCARRAGAKASEIETAETSS
ncbi:MAG: hypothetical protein ACJ78T_13985 [Myxococcales bacterium]